MYLQEDSHCSSKLIYAHSVLTNLNVQIREMNAPATIAAAVKLGFYVRILPYIYEIRYTGIRNRIAGARIQRFLNIFNIATGRFHGGFD